MEWFLYDIGLRHERVKEFLTFFRFILLQGKDFNFKVFNFEHVTAGSKIHKYVLKVRIKTLIS